MNCRLILLYIFIIAPFLSANAQFVDTDSIFESRRKYFLEKKRTDSIKAAEAEKIWDKAITTEGVHQPDGYFTLNILNETGQNAYIFIDGEYDFTVLKNDRIVDKKVRKIRSIYAITFDNSYKWGPIDLSSRTEEDFFWKLTLPQKKGAVIGQ